MGICPFHANAYLVHLIDNKYTLKLTELEIGKQAMLADFSVSRLHQRLLAMGFTPGSIIRVLRRLPMNGNLYVEIAGRYLAIRFAEAERITVNVSQDIL